jgi:hypothetical protein
MGHDNQIILQVGYFGSLGITKKLKDTMRWRRINRITSPKNPVSAVDPV